MNLFLTRNFLYCVTILFHTSYTKRLLSPEEMEKKQQELEQEQERLDEEEAEIQSEEEEADREDKKRAQAEARKALKKKKEKELLDDDDEESFQAFQYGLKKSKANLLEIERMAIKRKWCQTLSIQEVCPNKNVTFWLYNRNVRKGYKLDDLYSDGIKEAPFIRNKPIKILIHGYNGDRNVTPNKEIRPAYIKKGYNVISMNFFKVVQSPCAIQSYKNIVRVAKCLAKFMDKLTIMDLVHTKITFRDFHLLGFDIGVQVAGKAGLILSDQDKLLSRITSLDASLPIFYLFKNYITKQSAKFVDAIHTNIMTFGKMEAFGHCDFYVNKIVAARPCKLSDPDCNHRLAAVLFAESITSEVPFCGFELFTRSTKAFMGEKCPPTTRGVYIVTTNAQPPYARGCVQKDKGNNQDDEPSTIIKVNKTHTIRV